MQFVIVGITPSSSSRATPRQLARRVPAALACCASPTLGRQAARPSYSTWSRSAVIMRDETHRLTGRLLQQYIFLTQNLKSFLDRYLLTCIHSSTHIGLLNHTPGDSERLAFRAVGDFEVFWSLGQAFFICIERGMVR